MSQIADQFVGLPIEDLITGPLVGIAKGQAKLNEVTWDYVQEVAFETGSVVTLNSKNGNLNLAGQFSSATLKYVNNDEWDLMGDLT